jgi:hypothetical protein
MIWHCGVKNGIYCSWYIRGWEPCQVDDYGDLLPIFCLGQINWPYGFDINYNGTSNPSGYEALCFHDTAEEREQYANGTLYAKKTEVKKVYKKAEKVEKKQPTALYQGKIFLMPETEAFQLFDKWWNAKPQDKKSWLKKLDDHMDMLKKKEKDLIEHYDRMMLKSA